MGYSEEEIQNMCEKALERPEEFYKYKYNSQSCLVNYRGKTTNKGNHRYYTEVIAEFLFNDKHFKKIRSISEHSRKKNNKSYNMNHEGKYLDSKGKELLPDKINHSKEKIIAIDLFNQSKIDGAFDYIGKVIDYQTPLKAEQSDPYGEIDLLSVNENDKKIYILELKKNKARTNATPETMLRCILEAYTYYKILDKKELLRNFGLQEYDVRDIVISPLVFEEDKQYKEWDEMKRGNRPRLQDLIDKIYKKDNVEVIPYFLESKGNNKYKVKKYDEVL